MNARSIAVATDLTIAACILMFTVVAHSGHGGGLALFIFIALVLAVAAVGLTAALRVQRSRTQGH